MLNTNPPATTGTATATATRDKERTQRAILDAARSLFSEQGASVSLAEIARAAGVSKGALTHHFSSREYLERAVAEQVVVLFRDEVYQHVDLSENEPGKLLRGYIRALTANDSVVIRQTFSPTSFLTVIGLEHPLSPMHESDAAAWREAFDADGISAPLSLALRFAAEGLAASVDTPYLTRDELIQARDRLLDLTRLPG